MAWPLFSKIWTHLYLGPSSLSCCTQVSSTFRISCVSHLLVLFVVQAAPWARYTYRYAHEWQSYVTPWVKAHDAAFASYTCQLQQLMRLGLLTGFWRRGK